MVLDAANYGLPQRRSALYLVGRRAFRQDCTDVPGHPPRFSSRVCPRALMDTSVPKNGTPVIDRHARRLCEYKASYRQHMLDNRFAGQYAFVELGADPVYQALGQRTANVNICCHLYPRGQPVRVFSLGEGASLRTDRQLANSEWATFQGYPKDLGHLQLNEGMHRVLFGAAMPLPVVGAILALELEWILANRCPVAMGGQPSGYRRAWGHSSVPSAIGGDYIRDIGVAAARRGARRRSPSAHGEPAQGLKRRVSSRSSSLGQRPPSTDSESDIMPSLRKHCVRWANSIKCIGNRDSPGERPGQPATRVRATTTKRCCEGRSDASV